MERRTYITDQETVRNDAQKVLGRLHKTPARMVEIYDNKLKKQHGLHGHDALMRAEFIRLSHAPNPSS